MADEENSNGTSDELVYRALKGCPESRAASLVDILGSVDARERMVLTHAELDGGLRRLTETGRLREVGRHGFYDPGRQPGLRAYSGVSKSDYERAVKEYLHGFEVAAGRSEHDEDSFPAELLVIRWSFPDGHRPTEAEVEDAEALAKQLDPILGQQGLAEINGFEFGPGTIEMLIYGPADRDVFEPVSRAIADVMRAFPGPVRPAIDRR